MGTKRSLRCYAGFYLNRKYPAIVAQYDEKDIVFKMKDGIKAEAQISDLGIIGGIEFEDLYELGDQITVKVIRIHRNGQIKAVPMNTPVDEFIRKNPVSSHVKATIVKVDGECMLLKLAENVYCITKSDKNYHEGKVVTVKISSFNSITKQISIRVRFYQGHNA